MGYHSDNEKELGDMPLIASLSMGAPRDFILKPRKEAVLKFGKNSLKHQILLENGSLLIMSGEIQLFWNHAIPKRLKVTQPRINLTFRHIAVDV